MQVFESPDCRDVNSRITVSLKAELNNVLLVFRNKDIERAYRRDHFNRVIGPTRIIAIVGAVLFSLAWAFNKYVRATQGDITPEILLELELFNSILIYMMVPLCISLCVLSYLSIAESLFQFGASLVAVLIISTSALMVASKAELTSLHYSFGFLLFNTFVIYTLSQLRYLYATIINISGFIIYILALSYSYNSPFAVTATNLFLLAGANMIGPIAAYQIDRTSRIDFIQRRLIAERERELAIEKEKTESLLLNVLPESIAGRLKSQTSRIADRFDNVTVLFADIAGFTNKSETMSAEELVEFLDIVFSEFDVAASVLGLEKIKTIGDAYMVAGGVPIESENHAIDVAEFALQVQEITCKLSWPDNQKIDMRIGINTGPAVAGVIGRQKFIYDLWGDTVNTASRMESHGVSGEVQVTESSYRLLKSKFDLEYRGEMEIKGKGTMKTWLLKGRLN